MTTMIFIRIRSARRKPSINPFRFLCTVATLIIAFNGFLSWTGILCEFLTIQVPYCTPHVHRSKGRCFMWMKLCDDIIGILHLFYSCFLPACSYIPITMYTPCLQPLIWANRKVMLRYMFVYYWTTWRLLLKPCLRQVCEIFMIKNQTVIVWKY